MKQRVVEMARVSRSQNPQSQARMQKLYGKLAGCQRTRGWSSPPLVQEIADGVQHSSDVLKQAALQGMKQELETMLERVRRVRHQTRKRVFDGDTHVEGKLVSIFEPARKSSGGEKPASRPSSEG